MTLRSMTRAVALFVLCPFLAQAQTPAIPEPHAPRRHQNESRRPQRTYHELAGKRVVFANWYYIQPEVISDWRTRRGQERLRRRQRGAYGEAHHVGLRAPRGIKIVAEKPKVIGPVERPHRMIVQVGKTYKGWTDSDYYESTDAMHWQKKASAGGSTRASRTASTRSSSTPRLRPRSDTRGSGPAASHALSSTRFGRSGLMAGSPAPRCITATTARCACLRGGVSADGVHWTARPDPLVVEYSSWPPGTQGIMIGLMEYVIYTRAWSMGLRAREAAAGHPQQQLDRHGPQGDRADGVEGLRELPDVGNDP